MLSGVAIHHGRKARSLWSFKYLQGFLILSVSQAAFGRDGESMEMVRSKELGFSSAELESDGVWSEWSWGLWLLCALAVAHCLSVHALPQNGAAAGCGPGNSSMGRHFPLTPAWWGCSSVHFQRVSGKEGSAEASAGLNLSIAKRQASEQAGWELSGAQKSIFKEKS